MISFFRTFFALLLFSTQVLAVDYVTRKVEVSYGEEQSLKVFIHYAKGQESFAEHLEDIINNDFLKIHTYFDYIPRSELHIVSKEDANSANGSAIVFPRNTIVVHDYPPSFESSLAHTADWTRILLIHEYIHILSLEMTFGLQNFFRPILGSTMKWAQITPGWFAEGVAAWGESYFTGEGRIEHAGIKATLQRVLRNDKNCQKFSCFDGPKHYPFRQTRYWVGGFFFDYLEKKKAGTVACIVRDQARKIPLMFNGSWKKCYGKNLEDAYKEFRAAFLKEEVSPEDSCKLLNSKNCENLEKHFGAIDWFKGFYETNRFIAFIQSPNRKGRGYGKNGEKLIILDKSSKKKSIKYLNLPIEKIYKDRSAENSFILSLWKSGERIHHRISIKGKKIKSKQYILNSQCDEILSFKKGFVICKVYKNVHWDIAKVGYGKNKVEEVIYSFSDLENVEVIELNKESVTVVSSHNEAQKKEKPRRLSFEKKEVQKKENTDKSYSGIRYMKPDYLFFNYYFGNVSGAGIQTSASDPLGRNFLGLNLFYNWGIEGKDLPVSSSINYIYSRSKWSFGANYSKFYGQSVGVVNTYENMGAFVSKSYSSGNFNFSNSLSVNRANEFDGLLGYQRNLNSLGTGFNIGHNTSYLSSFYRSFNMSIAGFYKQNKDFDPYFLVSGSLGLKFNFSDTWKNKITANHVTGFQQTNLRDGVVYGGGVSSFLTGYFRFPSYHLAFQQIFGRYMTRAGFESSKRVWSIYKSTNFLGMHFRELDFFAGLEYLKSQAQIVTLYDASNDTFYRATDRRADVSSVYAGMRLKMDLLYLVPLQIDLYGSYTEHPLLESTVYGVLFNSYYSF